MAKAVKVILSQDIPHLGQKNEVKSVALGFVKNWLIPQKLAVLGTPQLIAQRERAKRMQEEKLKREQERYEKFVKELDGFVLRLRPKKTKKGTLYAAITSKIISEKLKEKGIAIQEKYIHREEPIKKVGEYEIPVKLSEVFTSKLKVIVQ